jgi:dGTPase
MMDWQRLLSARRFGHDNAESWTPARSPFQKDWDRIVFCSAFRRLQDKTQVHSLSASDYVRTRLTHSLEVSSVGRSLGAAVGQVVMQRHDLGAAMTAAEFGHIVAAASLAHDIGNPPFGHFGEDAIRDWFAGEGARYLAGLDEAERLDITNFEGNAQGFRVLTRLQNWRDEGGLRLTCATLAAFAKYPWGSVVGQARRKFGFFAAEADLFAEVADDAGLLPREGGGWVRHPLAYLMEAADDICYRVVDLEDGFKLGRIGFGEVEELLMGLLPETPARYRELDEESRRIGYLRAKAIGQLVDLAGEQFLAHETDIMAGRFQGDLLKRTPVWRHLETIEALTRARIFQGKEVYEGELRARDMIDDQLAVCCAAFVARERGEPLDPRLVNALAHVPDPPPIEAGRYAWLLAVTDFVSGMTDSYARSRWNDLGMAADGAARPEAAE